MKHISVISEEAETYTVEKVLGGSDGLNPQNLTRQVDAPKRVRLRGDTLSWRAVKGAIGYVVCYGDTAVAFTCRTSCLVPYGAVSYTVRAANETGGLGVPGKVVLKM